jgi:hypothetical protein
MKHRLPGLTILALTLFAILAAVPAHAASPLQPAAAPAVAQPGCQPVLDLGKALQGKGETCTATAAKTQILEPEFMALRRTCRCSCGYPCTTNADCGPGGACTAGITCC